MRSSPIANNPTKETELPPVFTAAEFARQLRCSRQNISKRLYRVPASDFKFPGGIETRAWTVTDLPNNVREEWGAVARQRGYRDLLAMMSHEMEFWQPALPLNQIHRSILDEAHKLRQIIRPLLESGANDLSRGLIEYNALFGRPITLRHFKRLLDRTAERAGYGGDLNRIELYLPERLKRAAIEAPLPPEEVPSGMVHVFADIQSVIDRTNPGNPEPENVKAIRELALGHYDRLVEDGVSNQIAGDKIRQLLFEKAPFLVTAADGTRRRDALRKQFSRWIAKRAAHGEVIDARKDNGRDLADFTKKLVQLKWFIPDAKGFYLLSNRTQTAGSVPEAIRRTISQEKCPKEIREEILHRQKQGKPLVPESIARQIICSAAVVQYHRNPTEAALRYANASGGSKFTRASGEYKPLRCGRRMIPDDGSINFVVCIPWEFPTSTTSKKFGVMLGRFQLLLFVDAVSYRISARSFVIRPKESYRTEDVLHLYNVFAQQYGLPDEVFHEGGIWNSRRVKDCLDRLNIRRQLVTSPHAKQPVENRFNKLWSVLSVIAPGQIGRYRGEMEKENELLRSCQSGATDPRKVFPMLSDAIRYIDQAISEANSTLVKTDVGSWVPDEIWNEQLAAMPLRKLDLEDAWKFAPCCELRTVRNGVRVKFSLFEGLSVPFHFNAPWLFEYEGAKVDVYFDPYGAADRGTIVLRQAWNGKSAGDVLGEATQTNDVTSYARWMIDLGTGPNDSARTIRQQQISAMRSNRKAITTDGKGVTVEECRDGLGSLAKFERGTIQREQSPEEIIRNREASVSARALRLGLHDSKPKKTHAELVEIRAKLAAERAAKWEKIRESERNNPGMFYGVRNTTREIREEMRAEREAKRAELADKWQKIREFEKDNPQIFI